MEYIDDYFKSIPTDEQKLRFEQLVISDVSFAEDVAFYISASGQLKEQLLEEKKQRFREIYHDQQKVVPISKLPVRNIIRYLAAASVVAAVILLTFFLTGNKTSPQQLADQYIQQNFTTLPVTMGSQDSLQTGLSFYTAKNFPAALAMFESLAKNDRENYYAIQYAGIAALRMENYEKALEYFTQLAAADLHSNPGKLYKAITLMKRNNPGDKDAAKLLLQAVRDKDLEGKADAVMYLKKLD